MLKTLGLGEQLSLCFSSITAVPLSQKGFPPEQLMPLGILAFCPDREHPEGEGLLWRAESSMRDVQLGATRFQGLIWRPVFYRDISLNSHSILASLKKYHPVSLRKTKCFEE